MFAMLMYKGVNNSKNGKGVTGGTVKLITMDAKDRKAETGLNSNNANTICLFIIKGC